MKAVFIVFIFLLSAAAVRAQDVDSSCLVLWQNSPLRYNLGSDIVWFNDDSAMVAMCDGPEFLDLFAKRKFGVYFKYYIMPDSVAPVGDSLDREWRDLGMNYSALRTSFDSIEHRFGSFTIQHIVDGSLDDIGDTTLPGDKEWYINFRNYVDVDSAKFYLSQLPGLNPNFYGVHFEGRPEWYEGVAEPTADTVNVWPQVCSSELHISGIRSITQIAFYDILGKRVFPLMSGTNGLLTVDVSTQSNGLYYVEVSGHFFKILIQR